MPSKGGTGKPVNKEDVASRAASTPGMRDDPLGGGFDHGSGSPQGHLAGVGGPCTSNGRCPQSGFQHSHHEHCSGEASRAVSKPGMSEGDLGGGSDHGAEVEHTTERRSEVEADEATASKEDPAAPGLGIGDTPQSGGGVCPRVGKDPRKKRSKKQSNHQRSSSPRPRDRRHFSKRGGVCPRAGKDQKKKRSGSRKSQSMH